MAEATMEGSGPETTGEAQGAPAVPDRLSAGQVARIWSRHLLSLSFPLNTLLFVSTGPHRWWVALLFVVPVFYSVRLDRKSRAEERAPVASMPAWPFNALLFTLAGLQFVNMALLVRMYSTQTLWSIDTLAMLFAVGSTSGYSAIVVAHELIHRTSWWQRQIGRLLLCTTMYEHFATEHVYGHHVRIGTPADPATARFGESFKHFYLRTVPAQFKSAWRLEAKRLGDEHMKPWDIRLLRSRVVQGLVVEWGIALAILYYVSVSAFFAYLLQALWATRALEVVNYFEHWGLTRSTKRVQPMHSWDTHSAFTYYSLTGLSRHADHHAFASRPYQQLRTWQGSPKLPRGYLAMFPLVLGRNPRFQRLATAELRRRGLGPFAPDASPELAALAASFPEPEPGDVG